MSKTKFYQEVIEKAFSTAKEYLLASALSQAEKEKEELSANLLKENAIKVPLVGGFNAGKSSLINAFINRNLLPTNIEPETAISYEMYYGQNERVELYRDDKKIDEKPLDDLKKFDVKPGDIAKVFVSTQVIKDLQNKGIIIVDMPGLDSGIQAHNDAILKYIDKGSAFVLVSESESGSLTTSAITFITELEKYNLKPAVLISKIDKKPAEEISSIKEYVNCQAKKAIGSETFVGAVSAANNDIDDFSKFLNTLDCDKITAEKFAPRIAAYINMLIISLKTQVDIAAQDIKDIDEAIKQLEAQREQAKRNINNNNADTPEKSTQDILDKVEEALLAKAEDFATMIFNKESSTTIQNAIMSTIRPVIINTLKEEGEQYAGALNTVVDDISKKLSDIVTVDSNIFDDIYGEFLPIILTQIGRLITKMPHVLGKILGVLLAILAQKLPEIIRWIFGKTDEAVIGEITDKIKSEIIKKMLEALRPKVLEMVTAQQERIKAAYIENINNNINNIIQSMQCENQNKDVLAAKIENIKQIIAKLDGIKSEI